MKKYYILAVCYGLSFFVPLHLIWFYHNPAWFPLRSYLNSVPLTLTLLLPAFFSARLAKPWLVLLYPVLMATTVLTSMHLFFYHAPISAHSYSAFFSTSFSESREFLQSKVNLSAAAFFVSLFILPSILLIKLLKMPVRFASRRFFYGLSAVLFIILLVFGFHRFTRDHQTWILAKSWQKYQQILAAANEHHAKIQTVAIDDIFEENEHLPKTAVIVIGESSNRNHWELYGYRRPTNPRLSEMQDELFIFKNPISAFATTMQNLHVLLSLSSYKEHKFFPIVPILQELGYHVSWISNQNTAELGTSYYHILSADKHIYINKGGDQIYLHSYDENLLPELKKILAETKNRKKVIFIHTMGSHVNYAARYPEEFGLFRSYEDIDPAPWRKGKNLDYINHYDNSIVYTDHILRQMIEILRTEQHSALLYLSDHGEEVYDTTDTHGHSDNLLSNHYVDIPVFFWLSEDMKKLHGNNKISDWKQRLDRPFATDIGELILFDLLGISVRHTPAEDQQFNPLSPNWQRHDRIVYGVNYDQRYGTKQKAD